MDTAKLSPPTDAGKPTFRVTAWDVAHENNRTRELKRLDWVPVPNRMDGGGYASLVTHDDGAAHFGAWIAILEIASRCSPRGTLRRGDGRPHDAASLSLISRLPAAVFRDAIPRLVDIGWLAIQNHPQDGATTSQEGAGFTQEYADTSQDDAPRARARTCALREGNGREGNGTESEGATVLPPTPSTRIEAEVINRWNAKRQTSWPIAEAIRETGTTRKHLAARIAEYGVAQKFLDALDDRMERMRVAYASPIGERQWVPSLRWLLEPNGWTKAGEKATPAPAQNAAGEAIPDWVMAEVEKINESESAQSAGPSVATDEEGVPWK